AVRLDVRFCPVALGTALQLLVILEGGLTLGTECFLRFRRQVLAIRTGQTIVDMLEQPRPVESLLLAGDDEPQRVLDCLDLLLLRSALVLDGLRTTQSLFGCLLRDLDRLGRYGVLLRAEAEQQRRRTDQEDGGGTDRPRLLGPDQALRADFLGQEAG